MTYDFNNGMGEDPQYKDKADFFGSEDASLEMGVIAVACMVVAWLFFKALFPWVVTASFGILAYRVFRGQTTLPALWARVRSLPGKLSDWRKRLHVKVVVKMLPQDVTDAEDLKGRLFHSPPANLDHQHYRDTFAILALTDRSPEQDLQLAQYLRGLKEYGEDPLRMMAAQMRRRIAPSTKPTPQPLAGVQGIGALPIPGVGWLSQYLMVALVLVGGFAFWQFDRANDNAAKAKSARADARQWQDAHQQTYDNAVLQAQRRDRETKAAREELEKTRALAQSKDARLNRLAARERKANEDASSGLPADLDQRLRERLAEPAAAAEPPPAGADSDRPAG